MGNTSKKLFPCIDTEEDRRVVTVLSMRPRPVTIYQSKWDAVSTALAETPLDSGRDIQSAHTAGINRL